MLLAPSLFALSPEISTSWGRLGFVAGSAVVMLAAIIVYGRLAGLRMFSKMSTFDFAVTVAFGSVMASVVLSGSSLTDGVVALGALLLCQVFVARGRVRFGLGDVVDNQPLLLMRDGRMLDENMRRARVTEADVRAKLREANVLRFQSVRAVVLETTGDVSVLHGDEPVDDDILAGVRDFAGGRDA